MLLSKSIWMIKPILNDKKFDRDNITMFIQFPGTSIFSLYPFFAIFETILL